MTTDHRVVPVCSTCAKLTPEEDAELTAAIRRLLPGTPARVLKGARKGGER